jgi:hypothetical protein
MRTLGTLFCVSVVATVALLSAPASRAGVDISFGGDVPLSDDARLFFSISTQYFDRDARMVDDWGHRFPDPDDLAVFLHVCSRTRLSPDVVYAYRRQGMSWYDVGARAGLPDDGWYVPVTRDPGPPYGKAYGYWKKHERDPKYAVRLSDRQVRDLVAVRMAHEYYGVPAEVAMDWRRGGADVRSIMTREYRTRHREDKRSHDERHDRGHDKHGDD